MGIVSSTGLSNRALLLAVISALCTPEGGAAQGRGDFWSNQCEAALSSLDGMLSPEDHMRVLDSVSGCGEAGGIVLARALKEMRHETDFATMERLFVRVARIRDREVLRTALEVATDREASDAARAVAYRIFIKYSNPIRTPRFADVGLPWDEWGARGRISLPGTVDHPGIRSGVPLPLDWEATVAQALRAIAENVADTEPARFGARATLRYFRRNE